jgi:hypothetical protein
MTKDAKWFLMDNMLANSTYWVAAGTVIAALMGYFGLSDSLTNVIVGFTSTLTFFQLAGAKRYARSENPHAVVLGLSISWRILLPLTFCTVLLPPRIGMFAAPLCYLAAQILYQFSSPAQNDWMVNLLNGRVRKNYYSLREAVFILTMSVSLGIVNGLLQKGQTDGQMRAAFLRCAVYISVLLLASLIPLRRISRPCAAGRKTDGRMRDVLRDAVFRPILLAGMLWNFAGMFNGGFSSTYQIAVLHLPFRTIMIWAVAANLLRTAATMGMARLAERFGWKAVCTGSMLCMAAAGVLWTVITPATVYPLYPVICALNSICYAGLSVGLFKFQLAAMPPSAQGIYFSVNAVCTGLASCAGSLLCSGLITCLDAAQKSLNLVFCAGVVLGLLSAGTMQFVKRRPEDRDL